MNFGKLGARGGFGSLGALGGAGKPLPPAGFSYLAFVDSNGITQAITFTDFSNVTRPINVVNA